MSSLKERVTGRVARFRERNVWADHLINTVAHYGKVEGNAQAGAVTFFGFLSFFPILALAFFAVGTLSVVFPDLRGEIVREIENLLPGVVGGEEGEIPLSTFETYAGTVGVVGLVGVLYTGLGWLSGMRNALENMFVLPRKEQPNFVVGKLRDVATLLLIGVVLVVSVALSGLVSGFSERLLVWVGVDPQAAVPRALLWTIGHGLAIAASTVLLLAMFRLLAQPHLPSRSLVKGALLGAVGFELLKGAANLLIAQTKGQPAFQAFGVALILLVWINYFSRLVMLAAAYAYTGPKAVARRELESQRAPAAAFGNGEEGAPRATDARAAALPVDTPDPQTAPNAPLAPATPSPVVAIAPELDDRPGPTSPGRPGGHGHGKPRLAGAAAAAAAAGAVVVAWRRWTR